MLSYNHRLRNLPITRIWRSFVSTSARYFYNINVPSIVLLHVSIGISRIKDVADQCGKEMVLSITARMFIVRNMMKPLAFVLTVTTAHVFIGEFFSSLACWWELTWFDSLQNKLFVCLSNNVEASGNLLTGVVENYMAWLIFELNDFLLKQLIPKLFFKIFVISKMT